eukprot:SAG22_NODE_3931_length_1464_cov_1.561172_2_plen_297_part_00
MERFGNALARGVWEANVPASCKPPEETASDQELEAWMRAKYEARAFLAADPKTAKPIDRPLQHGRSPADSSGGGGGGGDASPKGGSSGSSSKSKSSKSKSSKSKSSKSKSSKSGSADGVVVAAADDFDFFGAEPAPAPAAAAGAASSDDLFGDLMKTTAASPAAAAAAATGDSSAAPVVHKVLESAVVRQTAEMNSAKICELDQGCAALWPALQHVPCRRMPHAHNRCALRARFVAQAVADKKEKSRLCLPLLLLLLRLLACRRAAPSSPSTRGCRTRREDGGCRSPAPASSAGAG